MSHKSLSQTTIYKERERERERESDYFIEGKEKLNLLFSLCLQKLLRTLVLMVLKSYISNFSYQHHKRRATSMVPLLKNLTNLATVNCQLW